LAQSASTSLTAENVVHNGRSYARFELLRPENAERGHIGGIEMSYHTTLSRLPSSFDGHTAGALVVEAGRKGGTRD